MGRGELACYGSGDQSLTAFCENVYLALEGLDR